MPKLDKTVAEQVDSAESGSALIEEGTYEMVLIAVEAAGKDGKAFMGTAGPYWKWTFAFAEDAPRYAKRRQWLNTSLSPDSAWKMKEVFEAFGVAADTDTDDLVGKKVMVEIGSRMINQGEKTGDTVNTVKKLLPLDGASKSTSKGTASKANKDLF